MSKPGYRSLSVSDDLVATLDSIARQLISPTGKLPKRPEVIKFLADEYNKSKGVKNGNTKSA